MKLNISHKIFGIALVVLVLMLIVSVHSVRLAANISNELDYVANKHLPVSSAAAMVNVQVLEQAILLQEIFVAYVEYSDANEIAVRVAQYEAAAKKIMKEFEDLRRLLFVGERSHHIRAANEQLKKAFMAIEYAHSVFEANAIKLLSAHGNNDLSDLHKLVSSLDDRQKEIDIEIAALRRLTEELAAESVARVDAKQKRFLYTISVITTLATLLGIGFAFIVTKILVRAVRNLVVGTQAVENGNLDVKVLVSSDDEIGKLTGSFNNMVGELRLKERIKDTFGKYLDPRVVNELMANPQFIEPGGERREMTVMFIDLEGFTSISEVLAPDDLVNLMNQFFSSMTDAISNNKGVVDKFMGDAVMAYWGPPFTGPAEHALLACRAAIQALENLENLRSDINKQLSSRYGNIEINLRIGISTGDMIVGTVGSVSSKNYTIMGDPVNLGSRLEGANKEYGTRTLISERTRILAGDAVVAREIDLIKVKGKQKPTRVFELSNRNSKNPKKNHFAAGLAAYRRQDWNNAVNAFKTSLAADSSDLASKAYLRRIAHLRALNIPENWDGVWNFSDKF